MNNLMNTAFDAVHLAKGLAADAAPGIMNTVKNATLASVTIAKDAINSTELRENVHAGLVAAAAKTQELVEAAPDAAGQVSHLRILVGRPLWFFLSSMATS